MEEQEGCTFYFQFQTEAALLRRLEKIPGDKCFISMIEYGSIVKDKVEFLIVSPYGATLNEIMKKATMGQLSMDCSFVVGLQMLRAIQNLHSIGYIHRNISPASFHCGLGMDEPTLFLQDFRQARKFEENKKHVTARTNVKMYGCGRFANRACQGSKDQGRKDDLESWVYTLFYLMDNGSLSWKRENNSLVVIQQKDAFMAGSKKTAYLSEQCILFFNFQTGKISSLMLHATWYHFSQSSMDTNFRVLQTMRSSETAWKASKPFKT